MSSYSKQIVLVDENIDANVASTSTPIQNLEMLESYTIFCEFNGLGTGTTGQVSVQVSHNGTKWSEVQGSTLNYTDATDMHSWELQQPSHVMSRVVIAPVTPNGGTINIYVSRKGFTP